MKGDGHRGGDLGNVQKIGNASQLRSIDDRSLTVVTNRGADLQSGHQDLNEVCRRRPVHSSGSGNGRSISTFHTCGLGLIVKTSSAVAGAHEWAAHHSGKADLARYIC